MRPVALVYGALSLLCAAVALALGLEGATPAATLAAVLFGVLAACFAVLAVIVASPRREDP
jgi:hypothetical protein